MPGVDLKVNPIISNRFYLDIGGIVIDGIQEVSGLDIETDVVEVIQTGAKGKMTMLKTMGAERVKMGKLTLKFVTFKADPTAPWRADVTAGKITEARKNISLIMYDLEGEEQVRLNFTNAWPSKRAYSNFSSKGNDPVTITLTIEHEGVKVVGYNS